MFITPSIHIDRELTDISPNETNNGLAIRPLGLESPRVDLFLGVTPTEIRRNIIFLLEALGELEDHLPDMRTPNEIYDDAEKHPATPEDIR